MTQVKKMETLLIIVASCFMASHLMAQKAEPHQTSDNGVVDKVGNRYNVKLMRDGNLWTCSNLNVKIAQSYCYDNAEKNCARYGHLYAWPVADQACKSLGKGWSLPTDNEWNQLVMLYGEKSGDSMEMRMKAFKLLQKEGGSGFDALLGGGRDPEGQFARLEAHGFYWTATETDSSSAIYYNFAKGSHALYRQDGGEKLRAFSVRCIKKSAKKN
jgi:uncharacterized protein (TIGR02145 family)